MEFFIKKNATLPILKLQVVKDGRSDYNSFMDMIEESAIFFSMTNVETGIPKISTSPAGFVEKVLLDPNAEPEYYIYYQFKPQDTNKTARYEAQFLLRNSQGVLILPIREQLFINVQESFIAEDLPYESCYLIEFPCCNNVCPTTTTTTTECCCPQDTPTSTPTPTVTPTPGLSPTPTPTPGLSPTPTPTPGLSPTPTPTKTPIPLPSPIDEFCFSVFIQSPTPTPTPTITPTGSPIPCCNTWYYFGGPVSGSTFQWLDCSGNTTTFSASTGYASTICALSVIKLSGDGQTYLESTCTCGSAQLTPTPTPTQTQTPTTTPTTTPTPTPTPTNPPPPSTTPTPTPTPICASCTTAGLLPQLGNSVTYNGVTVTASGFGDVSVNPSFGFVSWCMVGSPPTVSGGNVRLGQTSSFTYILNFSVPVNNIVIRLINYNINSSGSESFTFTTNTGNPILSSCDYCCATIIGNVVTAAYCPSGSPSADMGGGTFTISNSSSFTTLTVTGPGGLGGTNMDICSDSVQPPSTPTPTPGLSPTPTPTTTVTPGLSPSATPTKTPTPTPTVTPGLSPTPTPTPTCGIITNNTIYIKYNTKSC